MQQSPGVNSPAQGVGRFLALYPREQAMPGLQNKLLLEHTTGPCHSESNLLILNGFAERQTARSGQNTQELVSLRTKQTMEFDSMPIYHIHKFRFAYMGHLTSYTM